MRTLFPMFVALALFGAPGLSVVPASSPAARPGSLRGIGPAGLTAQTGTDDFPHARHDRLFTSCADCHAGIEVEGRERAYPAPERCATCHDGEREPVVAWDGPEPEPSNLSFSHPDHRTRVREPAPRCVACHGDPEAASPMAVARPNPSSCLTCHDDGRVHLALTRDCRSCHVPLTETSLAKERVADFPRPPGHRSSGFLSNHAGERVSETCAVCHARESCARCHVNAETLPAVMELRPDERIAELVHGRAGEYPVPRSHDGRAWDWRHGPVAAGATVSCANCHARESCQTCHRDPGAVVGSLPAAGRGAQGVSMESVLVHGPDFAGDHAGEAARSESCSSCHAAAFCADCHEASTTPAFHGPNFMERHAADVYAASGDCVSCHSPEAFCRSCHASAGLESEGRTERGFHTSQAFWIVGHGQAARQAMESCASCHAQADCIRCHSSSAGWGINPHRPGYDGGRTEARNPLLCRRCHFDAGGLP